jgi:hypothetical protein
MTPGTTDPASDELRSGSQTEDSRPPIQRETETRWHVRDPDGPLIEASRTTQRPG